MSTTPATTPDPDSRPDRRPPGSGVAAYYPRPCSTPRAYFCHLRMTISSAASSGDRNFRHVEKSS